MTDPTPTPPPAPARKRRPARATPPRNHVVPDIGEALGALALFGLFAMVVWGVFALTPYHS